MASKNANEFKIDLKKFGKISRDKAELIFKKIALELDSRIVYSTPVDTGRARGNWYPTIGAPSNAVDEEKYSAGGLDVVAAIAATVSASKLGDVIWLTNNIEYIMLLENGSSKQAPRGMVHTNLSAVEMFYGAK